MELIKLFEIQAGLDLHINKEHPVQEDENRLAKKILALQVELGECANEWRGFKFWSNDQEPRTFIKCNQCSGDGEGYFSGNVYTSKKEKCVYCDGTGQDYKTNLLLEEYVDCLHFILSIGLELEFDKREFEYLNEHNIFVYTGSDTVIQFQTIFYAISEFITYETQGMYEELFLYFIGLSTHLGFTWDQIETAYLEKNKINHERQNIGY